MKQASREVVPNHKLTFIGGVAVATHILFAALRNLLNGRGEDEMQLQE